MITQIRQVLPAILGALVASLFCVAIAVGFVWWRADAQRRFLGERQRLCGQGEISACDLLRSACLKRSAEGCMALAETYLGPGPRHDGREGARLLGEACEYHAVDGCRRAALLYEEGRDAPPDRDRAADLRKRACALGDKALCLKGP